MAMRRSAAMWAAVLGVVAIARTSAFGQELKFEKYALPNGLTVILHQDHTLPTATINLWYKVGAKDELPGRSGFAHLFEHLMFMGTKRVPNGDFDRLMEAKGGSNNASTSLERTNYFSSGPASLLPTLLWLDADRMEDLGLNTSKRKLDLQRDVVRNEMRQIVENVPYQRAYEASFRIMYPIGHPYHNAVYGTHEDLEAATAENVRNFFATFYTPGNCSLVVAGDFDPANVKPLIERLYGTLPRGNAPESKAVPEVRLARVERATFLDKVPAPRIEFVFHSPGLYQPGDAEMDLTSALLTDGPASRIFKRLVVDEEIASDATSGQDSALSTSLFRITITAKVGADLSRIEREVNEEVAKFQKDGPDAQELAERKNMIELGKLSGLQSLSARADKLNEYQFYFGTPDGLKRDLDRYRTATPSAVRDWAGKVLTPDAKLVMQILPETPERAASARDVRPPDLAVPTFTPPVPEQFALSNGVRVQVFPRGAAAAGVVSMELVVAPGHPLDSLADAGLASLTADMTKQGATDENGKVLDGVEFSRLAESLGADVGADADLESIRFTATVLKRNFGPAAALVADAALRPTMSADDFEREKALTLDAIQQELDSPESAASRVAAAEFWGPGSVRSVPTDGTPDSVKSLTLDKVKAERARLMVPADATIVVAGDITPDEAKSALEPLFGAKPWQPVMKHPLQVAPTPTSKPAPGLRFYLVERPGAVQSVLMFVGPAVKFDSDDRIGLQAVNTALGGSFTSRLNQNLREAHGYTYGADSWVSSGRDAGSFHATTSVRADVTGDGLKEMLGELKRIASGDLSEAERNKALATLRNEQVERYGSLNAILSQAHEQLVVGQPADGPAKDLQALDNEDLAHLRSLCSKIADLDRGVLVIVGEKSKVLDQIDAAGGLGLPPPIVVDALGNPESK